MAATTQAELRQRRKAARERKKQEEELKRAGVPEWLLKDRRKLEAALAKANGQFLERLVKFEVPKGALPSAWVGWVENTRKVMASGYRTFVINQHMVEQFELYLSQRATNFATQRRAMGAQAGGGYC